MKRPSNRTALAFGLGAMVTLLAGGALAAYVNTSQLNEDAGWVAHTHEVLYALNGVRARANRAESAQRAFLVAGEGPFEQRVADSMAEARAEASRVARLTEDSPVQRPRILGLMARLQEAEEALARVCKKRRDGGAEAARQAILRSEGEEEMSALRGLVADMEGHERELLVDRERIRARAYVVAVATGLLVALAGLASLAGVYLLMYRHHRIMARAAEAVHEQRELLQATLGSIGDGVIATDGQGRVSFLNPVAQALTGWTQAEAEGKPLEEVFRIVNEDTRRSVENPAMRALREGRIVGLANHTVLIARTGRECPIDDSAAPIRTAGGAIAGAVLVFRDIAERKKAEEALRKSQEQARTILESIADAFFALDRGWRFTYVNHQAEKLLSRQPGDLLGKTIWDEYPGLAGSEFEQAYHRVANERAAVSVTSFFPDHDRWYEVNAYPSADGISVYFRDVSQRQRAEEDLRQLAADLSEADRRKDEFLATLAHELRNPLAPVRNALSVLRLAGSDAPAAEQAREMMGRQVAHMARLIDDLLDVSRISRDKLELKRERVWLADVLRDAVEASRPLLDAGGHSLEVRLPDEPVALDADPARLAQVFSNLLTNAAKYTDRGGRVELSARREGGGVAVSVRDDGIGIPPDLLPRVFDMFMQVDRSLEKAQGGLGIGLTLVRRLATMHGGTVEAASGGPGKGSLFTVRLPVAAEGPAPAARPLAEAQAVRRRVLVVDDNVDSAQSLALLLGLMGSEVRTEHDGLAAVTAAAAFVPGVVLLDIGMPKLNGYEACRRIRELLGPSALIVAMTGWGQEEDLRRSREAGFDHHLVKPVDLDELVRLMAGEDKG